MTDDDIALSLMLQEADDHWRRAHRKRWLIRCATFGLVPAAVLAAVIILLFA